MKNQPIQIIRVKRTNGTNKFHSAKKIKTLSGTPRGEMAENIRLEVTVNKDNIDELIELIQEIKPCFK